MPALMTSHFSRIAVAALAALSLLAPVACNKSKPAGPTSGTSANAGSDLPPEMVVATFGDQKITAGQLEEKVKPELAEMNDQFQKQKFQLRQQTLDRMVMENLLEGEAKKRGLANGEALIKA